MPDRAHASAWSREKNEVLIISSVDYFRSDLGLVSVGGAAVPGQFERIESNTYVEFGASERITIGGKVFYGSSWLTRGDITATARGVTEFEAFAQYQVFRNPRHAGAVKVAGGKPSDFGAGQRPALQSDGFDLEIAALYGRSLTFEPVKTFVAAEIGYRQRLSDAADQLRFLTTFGIDLGARWTLLAETFSVKSLENENPGGADFDVIKVRPSAIWRASRRFSIQAGVSKEIAGRNLDLGTTYFIGVRTMF